MSIQFTLFTFLSVLTTTSVGSGRRKELKDPVPAQVFAEMNSEQNKAWGTFIETMIKNNEQDDPKKLKNNEQGEIVAATVTTYTNPNGNVKSDVSLHTVDGQPAKIKHYLDSELREIMLPMQHLDSYSGECEPFDLLSFTYKCDHDMQVGHRVYHNHSNETGKIETIDGKEITFTYTHKTPFSEKIKSALIKDKYGYQYIFSDTHVKSCCFPNHEARARMDIDRQKQVNDFIKDDLIELGLGYYHTVGTRTARYPRFKRNEIEDIVVKKKNYRIFVSYRCDSDDEHYFYILRLATDRSIKKEDAVKFTVCYQQRDREEKQHRHEFSGVVDIDANGKMIISFGTGENEGMPRNEFGKVFGKGSSEKYGDQLHIPFNAHLTNKELQKELKNYWINAEGAVAAEYDGADDDMKEA